MTAAFGRMSSGASPSCSARPGVFHWVADMAARQAPAEKPIKMTASGLICHSCAWERTCQMARDTSSRISGKVQASPTEYRSTKVL